MDTAIREADAYADRVVLMREGEVVADGTAAELKAMGAARHVKAVWPGADTGVLSRIAGVSEVEVHGDAVVVTGTDSDAVARYLLTSTPASDLEIVARGLEDAFIALTTSPASTQETTA